MEFTFVTYATVAPHQASVSLKLRQHPAGVDEFLSDHITKVRAKADSGSSPLAVFTSAAARSDFLQLRNGDQSHFLATATQLTDQLIARMDHRAATGVFVCLQGEVGGVTFGAALKLQVMTEHAARLANLTAGDWSLEAVADVLDAPGLLQKGALMPDGRAHSEVVIGDRLQRDALYFTSALGIRTWERSSNSAPRLIAALKRHDVATAAAVGAILPSLTSGSTEEVLTEAATQVDALTPELSLDPPIGV
jgi:hypothetical protein